MKNERKETVWDIKGFKEITEENELLKVEGGTLKGFNSSIATLIKKIFG